VTILYVLLNIFSVLVFVRATLPFPMWPRGQLSGPGHDGHLQQPDHRLRRRGLAINLLYCLMGRARHADRVLPASAQWRPSPCCCRSPSNLSRFALIMLAASTTAPSRRLDTAILVNLPGESSSVVHLPGRLPDGAPGARRTALATAAIGSSSPAAVATLIVAVAGGRRSPSSRSRSPGGYFSLMVLASSPRSCSPTLARQGDPMVVFGLLLVDRHRRELRRAALHLRRPRALRRHRFVVVAMACSATAEIIANLEQGEAREIFTAKVGS